MARREVRSVLFLGTGNYYRSRFAEVLFNSVAERMGLPWWASSRGLALERGTLNVGPMAGLAVEAVERMGIRAADAVTRSPAQVTGGPNPRPVGVSDSHPHCRTRTEGAPCRMPST